MTDISIADPEITAAERDAVVEVLDSGQLAAGDVVRAFEAEFADYCEADHGIATVNGTAALHAALEAVGIEAGSGVVTTPFSFVATANAIRFAGGYPVFADIDPETFNLDPPAVEEILREYGDDIDAIVVVHLYGLPAEMDRFLEIAEAYDVALIEDAAQAHGAAYRGDPVGSIGDVGCFSFYPTKNMTSGEGGMITTDRNDIAERAAQFIDHGRGEETYAHPTIGHNYRMTDLAAAIGREQLAKLPSFVDARRANADVLNDAISGSSVTTPIEGDDRRHAYHQYTIQTDRREAIQRALAERGVDTAVYYPTCIHELGCYDSIDASVPTAERTADRVLSLPVHPNVEDHQLHEIGETVTAANSVEV